MHVWYCQERSAAPISPDHYHAHQAQHTRTCTARAHTCKPDLLSIQNPQPLTCRGPKRKGNTHLMRETCRGCADEVAPAASGTSPAPAPRRSLCSTSSTCDAGRRYSAVVHIISAVHAAVRTLLRHREEGALRSGVCRLRSYTAQRACEMSRRGWDVLTSVGVT